MKTNHTLIIAIGIWAALFAAHFFGILFFFEPPLGPAAVDSVIHFAFFGVLVWGCSFLIRYIDVSERPTFASIFNLAAASLVCSLIWLFSGYALMNLLFKGNDNYIAFYDAFFNIRLFEGMLMFTIMVSVLLMIQYREKMNQADLEEANLKNLVHESRIQALNSQINPHFLFNSLNSISAQTVIDPDKAREMLSQLSEYLRYNLESEKQSLVPFEKELENAFKYMEIERIRFGKRLDFAYRIQGEARSFLVPRMLLQPLFENIIKHGVEQSTDPIHAELKVEIQGEDFVLSLENQYEESKSGGSKLGLRNLEERLIVHFGQGFNFQSIGENGMFKVFLMIRPS